MNLINKNLKRTFDFDFSKLDKSKIVNINESKTPLAHVHAGSLRRIFLHYQLQQWLIAEGYRTNLFIGNDDYDPYDYFPEYFNEEQKAQYRTFLGHPLCSIPAPKGSGSYADFYFNEMIKILYRDFGITVSTYKTSTLYKKGVFDGGIRMILNNIDKLNEIYKSITMVSDKFDSKPLQVICPGCGNMRTTKIVSYKKDEVEIVCNNYKLRNVEFLGCGFTGWLSPYKGQARLFWKLEWPIRWFYLKIQIEGGRKDQNSNKGAREFAETAYKFLFQKDPPLNLPYDFCHIRSLHAPKINRFGISATEALKFLPPQLFFYLLTKTRNTQPISIDMESNKMIGIYKKYAKIFLGDHDGKLFNQILENARFDLGTKFSAEQESLAKCLNHYLRVSENTDAWFLDLKKKRANKAEQDLLVRLRGELGRTSNWQASNLQYIFRKIASENNFLFQSACLLIYKLIINRQTGPRIGVLFEKIGKERLLTYLTSY